MLCSAGRARRRWQSRPERAAAKSLGYVEDATKVDAKANPNYKPGQICANCLQAQVKEGAEYVPCNIFAGRDVAFERLVQGVRQATVTRW